MDIGQMFFFQPHVIEVPKYQEFQYILFIYCGMVLHFYNYCTYCNAGSRNRTIIFDYDERTYPIHIYMKNNEPPREFPYDSFKPLSAQNQRHVGKSKNPCEKISFYLIFLVSYVRNNSSTLDGLLVIKKIEKISFPWSHRWWSSR